MQNKHYFFFLFGNPNVWGGGRGSSRLGQIPNFYRKFVLQASLNITAITQLQRIGMANLRCDVSQKPFIAFIQALLLEVDSLGEVAETRELKILLLL